MRKLASIRVVSEIRPIENADMIEVAVTLAVEDSGVYTLLLWVKVCLALLRSLLVKR